MQAFRGAQLRAAAPPRDPGGCAAGSRPTSSPDRGWTTGSPSTGTATGHAGCGSTPRSFPGGLGHPEDLRPGEFLTGGEAWAGFRRGEIDASRFGVYGTKNWGAAEIRGNAVRDLAALNKVENLPWDEWGRMSVLQGRTGRLRPAHGHVAAVCDEGRTGRYRGSIPAARVSVLPAGADPLDPSLLIVTRRGWHVELGRWVRDARSIPTVTGLGSLGANNRPRVACGSCPACPHRGR